MTGLAKRYPHQLSGGQQQRVSFARAVVTRPKLILFDEPLSALDAALRSEMRTELTNLVKSSGLTVLYVTHDQTEAMSMSDNIVVMKEGQVLQIGSPENIYQTPSHPFVANFIGKANWLIKDHSLFRPEHVRWQSLPQDLLYEGTVQKISYLGDHYEIQLNMRDRELWTCYHQNRLEIGSKIAIFLSPQNIHHILPQESLEVANG